MSGESSHRGVGWPPSRLCVRCRADLTSAAGCLAVRCATLCWPQELSRHPQLRAQFCHHVLCQSSLLLCCASTRSAHSLLALSGCQTTRSAVRSALRCALRSGCCDWERPLRVPPLLRALRWKGGLALSSWERPWPVQWEAELWASEHWHTWRRWQCYKLRHLLCLRCRP